MARCLRYVLFDIDDTLYSTSDFARTARANGAAALVAAGVRLSEEDLLRELDDVVKEFSSNYEHHFDKLLLRLPESSWKGLNPAVLVASAVSAYHNTKLTQLKPFPDVIPGLIKLKNFGLPLGVITAGLPVKQAEKLIRLGLLSFFESNAIFIADQIGFSKPNAKLYLRACRDVGVTPAEAMYVGDNPANDIDPANEAGMITVRIRRGGKYDDVEPVTPPQFEVRKLTELCGIIEAEFAPKSAG